MDRAAYGALPAGEYNAPAEDVDLEDAEPTLTPEELEELQELDEVNEEDENVPTNTVGAVYQEKSLSDFDAASPAVYTCKVLAKSSAYTERTTESSKVFTTKAPNGRDAVCGFRLGDYPV